MSASLETAHHVRDVFPAESWYKTGMNIEFENLYLMPRRATKEARDRDFGGGPWPAHHGVLTGGWWPGYKGMIKVKNIYWKMFDASFNNLSVNKLFGQYFAAAPEASGLWDYSQTRYSKYSIESVIADWQLPAQYKSTYTGRL